MFDVQFPSSEQKQLNPNISYGSPRHWQYGILYLSRENHHGFYLKSPYCLSLLCQRLWYLFPRRKFTSISIWNPLNDYQAVWINLSICFLNFDVSLKSDFHPSQEQGRRPIPVDDIKASSISFINSKGIFVSLTVRLISLAIDMKLKEVER